MTVEYQETRFGIKVGKPKPAGPGKVDITMFFPFTPWHTPFVEGLRVESSDEILVGGTIPFSARRYQREKINEEKLKSSPFNSLPDLILWRRRHYTYRPDTETPSQS